MHVPHTVCVQRHDCRDSAAVDRQQMSSNAILKSLFLIHHRFDGCFASRPVQMARSL